MKRRGLYRVRRVFFFLVNRVEHQKRTLTATKWWPFGFVFGVQLGSLEKKKTRCGPVHAALVHICTCICTTCTHVHNMHCVQGQTCNSICTCISSRICLKMGRVPRKPFSEICIPPEMGTPLGGPLYGFPRLADHFFFSESSWKPKRTQTATEVVAVWVFFCFSTRPTAMGGTDYNALGSLENLRSLLKLSLDPSAL